MNMVPNSSDDWENLKYFIALAKAGGLKKAAKVINSNHTTVYRRVRQFEEFYGLRLFERTPSGYYLTAQGEELLQKVRGLDEQMESIFGSLQGLDNQLKGEICLTTTHSLAHTFVPSLIAEFHENWPNLSIDMRVSNQFFNLSKREADIALRPANNVPEHLIGRRLGRVNFGVFRSLKFKSQKKVNAKNLRAQRFVGMDESMGHLLSKQWLDRNVASEQVVCHVDELVSLGRLCAEGVGLAVLPLYFQKTFANLELMFVPKDFIGSDLWILSHKNLSKVPKIKVCSEFFYSGLKNKLVHFLE